MEIAGGRHPCGETVEQWEGGWRRRGLPQVTGFSSVPQEDKGRDERAVRRRRRSACEIRPSILEVPAPRVVQPSGRTVASARIEMHLTATGPNFEKSARVDF